jgi:hypothetical protein
MSETAAIDWKPVEKDYRAGIRPLRDIAKDNGISEGAIRKRAKRDGWTRDLTDRIRSKAVEKVRKAEVRSAGTQKNVLSTATEKQVVDANSDILASADLINRKDVLLALDVSRSQLEEVASLCDPLFRGDLDRLGDLMDQSTPGKPDRAAEMYRYIISLAGRIKMGKDVAATHGVYIPMQRKILKLDEEGDRNQSNLDALLAKINAAAD